MEACVGKRDSIGTGRPVRRAACRYVVYSVVLKLVFAPH